MQQLEQLLLIRTREQMLICSSSNTITHVKRAGAETALFLFQRQPNSASNASELCSAIINTQVGVEREK
jgi:hypothetical protein